MSAAVDGEPGQARFRLRFLLHEIDLNGPEILLGRSPDCHITIEDPLVSREHARIRIDGDQVFVSDLRSRNGVQVNGRLVRDEVALCDGDRIRIGTQELVFCCVSHEPRSSRSTGCIVVCGLCGIPYPEEASHCPHCGATGRGEDTMPGFVVEPEGGWTLQLMLEGVSRAVAASRDVDAFRMMQRLATHVERELAAGRTLHASNVAQIASAALALLSLNPERDWLDWALDLHMRCDLFPGDEVVNQLERIRPEHAQVVERVDSFLIWWESRASELQHGDAERWARLRKLVAKSDERPSTPPG